MDPWTPAHEMPGHLERVAAARRGRRSLPRAARLRARRHDLYLAYRYARRVQGASPVVALRVARLAVAQEIVGHFRAWRHPMSSALAQHWCGRDNRLAVESMYAVGACSRLR